MRSPYPMVFRPAIVLAWLLPITSLAQGQEWRPIVGLHPSPSGQIGAVYRWDPDGPGPITPWIVIAGSFNRVGNVDALNVAGWDGQSWHALGGGVPAISQSLVEFNGELYAGTGLSAAGLSARFATIDGSGTALARFDGASWHPVAVDQPGLQANAVPALDVFQNQLVVSVDRNGQFSQILLGNPANWTSLLPSGVIGSGTVYAFLSEASGFYAGGHFAFHNGPISVSQWDGSSWMNIGQYRDTHCLLRFGGELHVGGFFTAGGNIARWDGSAYHTVGVGLGSTPNPASLAQVTDLLEHDGRLVALGDFTFSGATPVPYAGVWDGTMWAPLGAGAPARMRSGVSTGTDLYFGGAHRWLLRWDGSEVTEVPGELRSGSLTQAVEYAGQIIGSGLVSLDSGLVFTTRLVRSDGSYFEPMSAPSSARYLFPDGNGLYVLRPTGLSIGGSTPSVARFDGMDWHAVGAPVDNGIPSRIARHENGLVMTGSFTSIGGVAVSRVARWDGTAWGPMGDGFETGEIAGLASHEGNLYAAGAGIRLVPGGPTHRIVRWDGTSWTDFGTGLDLDQVRSLVTYGGELIAAGTPIFEQTQRSVMRWNGTSWEPFGQFLGEGVRQLSVVNDTLYAVGDIAIPGQTELCQIARWDGSAWVPELDAAHGGSAEGLTSFRGKPLLYGSFTSVNAQPGCFLAHLTNPCPPDITTTAIPGTPGYLIPDGTLNNDDFFAYLIEFIAGNIAVADLTTTAVQGAPGYGTPNGTITNDDFFYYLILFTTGC